MSHVLRRLDLPPIWAALACVAIRAWAGAVSLAPLGAVGALLGWVLIALGAGLMLWAAQRFWRHRTPIEPRHTPNALITDGPFRYTRNPIYRGMVMAVAGWALICGEASALAIVAAFAWLLIQRFARPEQAVLEAHFGDAYREWATRVRRLI